MMQTQSSHTYTTGKIEARVFGMDALRHLEDKFPSGIPEDSEHRNLRPDASGHGIQDAALARKGIEREFLSSELNLPEEKIFFLKQIHGPDVIRITEHDFISANLPIAVADGMITREPDVALVIRTADCLPLFFHSGTEGEHSLVGVIHCGWRGLSRGILPRAIDLISFLVEQMKREKQDVDPNITVFPGPYICPSTYEVGHEVAAQFPIIEQKRSARGRPLLDLYKNAALQLEKGAGSAKATFQLKDPLQALDESRFKHFYSHRRGDRSRNLNVIRIKGSE